MNEPIIIVYKLIAVTGFTRDYVRAALSTIRLSPDTVYDFCIATGKFPSKNESDFIMATSFEAWYSLFQMEISIAEK